MSQDVDRDKVFQTTRVRTTLKNDLSWLNRATQPKEGTEKARTGGGRGVTKPSPVRQSSYVLSAVKKFDSSTNQTNVDVSPKEVQPTPKTTEEKKPQAPVEQAVKNDEAQTDVSVSNTAVESVEAGADVSVEQVNGEHIQTTAEVVKKCIQNGKAEQVLPTENATVPQVTVAETKEASADVPVEQISGEHVVAAAELVEECVQNGEAEQASPVEDAAVCTAAEINDADASTKHINGEQVEVAAKVLVEECIQNAQQISTDEAAEQFSNTVKETKEPTEEAGLAVEAQVDGPVLETSAAVQVEGSAEVPVVAPVEEPSSEPEPVVEEASVKPTVQSMEESSSPEQVAEEITQAVAEVSVESSSDKTDATDAVPAEEAALQESVETAAELLAEAESESPTQAAEAAPEENCEKGEEVAVEETVEAVTEVSVVSPAETPATEAAQEKVNVEAVPDLVADAVSVSAPQTAAEPEVKPVDVEVEPAASVEQTVGEVVECEVRTLVEQSTEATPEITAAPEVEATEPAAAPDVEDGQDVLTYRVIEVIDDTEPEVKPVESEVEPAVSAEPVLQPTVVEVVECEIQPAVEQSIESAPADPVVDAPEPQTAPDIEITENKLNHRIIELTDALDVEIPAEKAAPEPVADPTEAPTGETKPIQEPDATNITEEVQTLEEEPPPVYILKETIDGIPFCSFCDQLIDGNVKISFSEPLVRCHPDCLKCGVCAKALGDLLTPMFLHKQVIQCDGCFAKALKT